MNESPLTVLYCQYYILLVKTQIMLRLCLTRLNKASLYYFQTVYYFPPPTDPLHHWFGWHLSLLIQE